MSLRRRRYPLPAAMPGGAVYSSPKEERMRAMIREGVIAGVIGATSVVVWFGVIDVLLGTPFRTPTVLGRAFFNVIPDGPRPTPDLPYVLGYTAIHYLAFLLVGVLVAAIVRAAQRDPSVLAGALILFIMFEVGFHGMISMFSGIPAFGALTWYNVAIGNLIAAVSMGTYMWRAHPELKEELNFALRR
jgi:hypothetical protein